MVSKQEFFFRKNKSTFCWRVPSQVSAGTDLLDAILHQEQLVLNKHYPNHAPWQPFREDSEGNPRIYFQVYREEGEQPWHYDTPLTWYRDDNGVFSAINTILAVNDGKATQFADKPTPNVFECVRNYMVQKKYAQAAKGVEDLLQRVEANWVDPNPAGNRAGQMLCFHPGEQAHRGVGYDFRMDPLKTNWIGRVVMFVMWFPQKYFNKS